MLLNGRETDCRFKVNKQNPMLLEPEGSLSSLDHISFLVYLQLRAHDLDIIYGLLEVEGSLVGFS